MLDEKFESCITSAMRPLAVAKKKRKSAPIGTVTYTIEAQTSALQETFVAIREVIENLPSKDNETGAVKKMLQANAILRNAPWPSPFDETTHRLQLGDARNLNWLSPESVHLVVTSPLTGR
ncbi:MAG: hypothetical protein ABIQ35_05150 [Verrucomicrobiota bacterium]